MNINLSVRRTVANNTMLYTVPVGQRFVLRYIWLNVTTGRAYIRLVGPSFSVPFDIVGLDTYTVSIPDPPPAEPEPPPPEEDSVFHRHRKKEPEHHTEQPAQRGMTTSTPQAIALEVDYMELPANTVISLDMDSSGGTASAGISGSTST